MSVLRTSEGRAIQSIFEVIASSLPEYVNSLCTLSPYRETAINETYSVSLLPEFEIHTPGETSSNSNENITPSKTLSNIRELPSIESSKSASKALSSQKMPVRDSDYIYSTVLYLKSDREEMTLFRSVLYDLGGGPAFDAKLREYINTMGESIWEQGPPILPIEKTSVTPPREHLRSLVVNDSPLPYTFDIAELPEEQYVALPLQPIRPCVKSSLTPRNGIAIKLFLQIRIVAEDTTTSTSKS